LNFFRTESPPKTIGIAGYGEGGLMPCTPRRWESAHRRDTCSGYFDSRQLVWQEADLSKRFWTVREFGDAEIASLIMPRHCWWSTARRPTSPDRRQHGRGSGGPRPGGIHTPDFGRVEMEVGAARGNWRERLARKLN